MKRVQRQKVLTGLIISILLISLLGFLSYRSAISRVITELEHSDFTVTQFNLTNSTDHSLTASGIVKISGDFIMLTSKNLQLDTITIHLFNQTASITSATVPLQDQNISDDIHFQVDIPVDESNPSALTTSILTYIMVGTNFIVNFSAEVFYHYQSISGSLDFSNILKFNLEQNFLEFQLYDLDLYDPLPQVNFSLYNPFSIDLTLSGTINVILEGNLLGSILLDPTLFVENWTKIIAPITLLVPVPELFSIYFAHINQSIALQTELVMSLGDLAFSVSPVLSLNPSTVLDVSLTAVNSLNINTNPPALQANINLTIMSRLPVALNISDLSGTIRSDQGEIGLFNWHSNSFEFLSSSHPISCSNVSFNSTSIINDLFALFSTYIRFYNVHLTIFIQNTSYSFFISKF